MLGPAGACLCFPCRRVFSSTHWACRMRSIPRVFSQKPASLPPWPPRHGLCPSSGAIYVAEVRTAPWGKASKARWAIEDQHFPIPYEKDFK